MNQIKGYTQRGGISSEDTTRLFVLYLQREMIHTRSHQNQTQSDVAPSVDGRRRIIFPTIHDKYNVLPTPVLSRTKLSDHIKVCLSMTSSIESDMPSLTSLSIVSDSTSSSIPSMNSDDSRTIIEDCNYDALPARKAVRFDPRIWVHEFDRTDADKKALWFTVQDLNAFKFGAMQCIMAYNSRVQIKATTQRSNSTLKSRTGRVLFSHPALGNDNEYDHYVTDYPRTDLDSISTSATNSPLVGATNGRKNMVHQFREAVAENEIRNILVVDSQEICLKLYEKGLRRLFPNAMIMTARNKEEAMHHIQELSSKTKSGNDFDVVVNDDAKSFEEHNSSDLTLFQNINQSIKTPGLNISVVSQRIATSQNRYMPEATDLRWTKPPPSMNDELRDQMLKTLLMKRGRNDIAKKLFT